jgi:CheY-like chemotaxis protein
MNNTLKSIMLVDDNADDNFIHTRLIKKNDLAEIIIVKQTALGALEYLKSKKENSTPPPPPDLLFLDINMPGMNGWEFLEEYSKLSVEFKCKTVIIMLTTSDNPADLHKAKLYQPISDFRTKPLTVGMIEEIISNFFKQ